MARDAPGVDSHGVHFHLGNFQLVNRVDDTNTNMAPDLKNSDRRRHPFRTYPFTDMILASKINMMWLPFQIPRNTRLLDPLMPPNVSVVGTAPVAGGIVPRRQQHDDRLWLGVRVPLPLPGP